MATRRWSVNPEDRMDQVSQNVGAAIVNKNIELTVDFGALAALTPTMTGTQAKMHVLDGIDKIRKAIEVGIWPPA